MTDPRCIALNAVSGTTPILSEVFKQGSKRAWALAIVNGTVNGVLQLWHNNLPEAEYQGFVAAAGNEKANTAGWWQCGLTQSPVGSGGIAISQGQATMDANGGSSGSPTVTPNNVGLAFSPGPARRRFRFVPVSGSGTFRVDQVFVGEE